MRKRSECAYARRGLARFIAPTALALAFSGLFAVAVMVLDRENRALDSNVLYVVAVELAFASLALAATYARAFGTRLRIGRALGAPLDAEPPAAGPGPELAWRELVLAVQAGSRAERARRETAAR
ncbi:MAG: hypothetical protein Q8M76_19730, partial [Spirochaetaceae bacterium]|nr:hypothetical protein [Spirochaetaceae bacterium]